MSPELASKHFNVHCNLFYKKFIVSHCKTRFQKETFQKQDKTSFIQGTSILNIQNN